MLAGGSVTATTNAASGGYESTIAESTALSLSTSAGTQLI